MDTVALRFEPISFYSPGALADIIGRSYADLVESWPEAWKSEAEKWADFDRQAFAHPDTVGRCVFVSCFERQPIGLASYDPRHGPEFGIVGQNCVLPEFRGRDFGKLQILEVLSRLKKMRMRAARVTTSGHPFFLPALAMYRGLGFREIRRFAGGPDPRYQLVEMEKGLPF